MQNTASCFALASWICQTLFVCLFLFYSPKALCVGGTEGNTEIKKLMICIGLNTDQWWRDPFRRRTDLLNFSMHLRSSLVKIGGLSLKCIWTNTSSENRRKSFLLLLLSRKHMFSCVYVFAHPRHIGLARNICWVGCPLVTGLCTYYTTV